MTLPTPPSTSHRDKENRFGTASRVVWSPHNQYHSISSPPRFPAAASASKELPTKSILKRRADALMPIPEDNQREVTPEPSDPLVNLKYLEYPVSKIIAVDASLRDLIEGYSVLAARLRSCVSGLTDADASWPLFQPLRKNRDTIVEAFIRDLGRALVDPGTVGTLDENRVEEEKVLLPSPKNSPRRKKGMSAEQVKYARDLCTISHSVMKLLAVIFTMPAIYRVFSDDQLRVVLTQVLAIPLANELPTPNARKTCALSIWLIQAQRLPSEVLVPAKDRIAYALRRGMEGELGKEGKKGSASDGLKAIHDLSVYQPSTFVPAFTELLPSILSNLLAPTLALRSQACHALGGLVLGCTSLPPSYIHTRIAALIAAFLTTAPSTPRKSPSKSTQDPAIIRTLRTTLSATEPQHAAQGPVWGLIVLANFIVLLGPSLCTDIRLSRVISALLALSMRHKKSSVRALACIVWRCVAWAYFQPPLLPDPDGESEVEHNDHAQGKQKNAVREAYWKVVKSVVDMGAGVATMAALLGRDLDDEDNLRRAMSLIKTMIKRGGQTCGDAMEIVKHFVSFEVETDDSNMEWNSTKLLAPAIFSALPGLLTVDYKSLVSAVRPIFEQCPQLDDIRTLTREEITRDWVFDELVEIWKEGLANLEMPDDADTPHEIIAIWDGLLKANVAVLQDVRDDEGTSEFALRAVNILIEVLQDANLDLTLKVGPVSNVLPTSPTNDGDTNPQPVVKNTRSNTSLKLSIVRTLWTTTRTAIPHSLLGVAGEKFISCLMKNEDEFADDARTEWALLCAEVLVVCDVDDLRVFWGHKVSPDTKRWEWCWTGDVRSLVWKSFVDKWKEDGEVTWEGAIVLLGVPFVDSNTWDLSTDDIETWDELLCYTISKALDYGIDSIAVLDRIAESVVQNCSPTSTSSTRIADILMSHLDMPDARQIPEAVIEFVNDTLVSTYPPEPRNKVMSLWMIRSLTRVIETCPPELTLNLLEAVQEGLCIWISDEYRALTQEEYSFDILPLYQTALVVIQPLPQNIGTLENVSSILESAFCGRSDKPAAASEAFTDFWQSTYSTMPVPTDEWPTKIQTCLGITPSDETSEEPCEDVPYYADTSLDDSTDVNESVELAKDNDQSSDELEPTRPGNDSELNKGAEDPSQSLPTEGVTFGGAEEPLVLLGPAFSALPPPSIPQEDESDPSSQAEVPFSLRPLGLPSTPTRPSISRSRTLTPPRPHKPSAVFQAFPLQSPGSPRVASQRTPATPKRTPMASSGDVSGGSCTSSRKRRRIENKENESPRPSITSVVERIGTKSPGWPRSFALGKRRLSDEWEEERASKKGKSDSELLPSGHSSGDSEDERLVESSLLVEIPRPADSVFDLFSTDSGVESGSESAVTGSLYNPRKRKGVFMDAVEVPTLRDVYKQLKKTASLDSGILMFTTPSNQGRRLTRSASKVSRLPIPFAMLGNTPSTKPGRTSDGYQSKLIRDTFSSSSPLRALRNMDLPGSDDSIMATPPPAGSSEPSSDDDPHLGQVTPHHLISPTLRRVRALDDDPPSDDSNMSASPSRDIVSRRLQRLGSFPQLKPQHLDIQQAAFRLVENPV